MSGLDLQKHYSKAFIDGGFRRILGWECLYFHVTAQVVLSVYADAFKLADKKLSPATASQVMRDKG